MRARETCAESPDRHDEVTVENGMAGGSMAGSFAHLVTVTAKYMPSPQKPINQCRLLGAKGDR